MKGLLGLIVILFSQVAAAASEVRPFGIEPGASITAYGKTDGEFGYRVVAPNPHPDFGKTVIVHSTPETGACLVRAESEAYDGKLSQDKTGAPIRQLFQKIKEQLDSRYGTVSVQEPFSLFDAGDEWLSQLATGERYYKAVWNPPSRLEGVGISEVLLQIKTVPKRAWQERSFSTGQSVSSGNAYLSLQYEFSNYTECKRLQDETESNRANADAAKL